MAIGPLLPHGRSRKSTSNSGPSLSCAPSAAITFFASRLKYCVAGRERGPVEAGASSGHSIDQHQVEVGCRRELKAAELAERHQRPVRARDAAVQIDEPALDQADHLVHDGKGELRIGALRIGDRHPAQHGARADQELVLPREALDARRTARHRCSELRAARARAISSIGMTSAEGRSAIKASKASGRLAMTGVNRGASATSCSKVRMRGRIAGQRREQMRARRSLPHHAVETAQEPVAVDARLRRRRKLQLQLRKMRARADRARRRIFAALPVAPIAGDSVGPKRQTTRARDIAGDCGIRDIPVSSTKS